MSHKDKTRQRDEARREVFDLRARVAELERERDALRAEVERLTRERDEARAGWTECLAEALGHHEDMQADNERLREALRYVLSDPSMLALRHETSAMVLAALAGAPSETRREFPPAVRAVLDMTGEPTPEVLNRLSDVQHYVRHGEPGLRDRALAERAWQWGYEAANPRVPFGDVRESMREDVDALMEEP